MPGREVLPSTLERSPKKAQETWIKAHDSAVETYGEGERAHRTAYAALEHSFEKVGDHWAPQAKKRSSRTSRSAEGVNVSATKEHLYETARRLDVKGRSHMTKSELVDAIKKANRRATAKAR